MEKYKSHILLILFSSYHLLLTLVGFTFYPGSKIYFTAFSLSFYILVVWNNRIKSSPSILFLSIMIWLGFFQKIVFHLFTNFQFVTELIGQFKGTPEQWDQVLVIATLAALGISATTFVFSFSKFAINFLTFIPDRYPKTILSQHISLTAFFLIMFILLVATLNVILGINLSGLVAMTVLPWPMNAVIGWLLCLGFAISWTFLMDYELSINKSLTKSFIFYTASVFICSVSIISRGLLVFHILPILYLIYRNRNQFYLSKRALALCTGFVLILFILNTSCVTMLRGYFYDANFSSADWTQKDWINAQNQQLSLNQSEGEYGKLFSVFKNKAALNQVAGLVVNRWIGVEGAMAVVAYPEKGFHLIKQTLVRVPAVGEFDLFEKIINTQYKRSMKFSFANIPGPVAFFFYSGSETFVFLGFVLFSSFLLFLDCIVWLNFRNSFLSALIGFYMANNVAQFGISPRPLLISILMTATGLIVVYFMLYFLKLQNWKSFSRK